ncbi:MAG: M14 family zinc carboxypeptidase [Thermaurantimonas sp.]|uniref:M14 family zinc carboxypeptidase n=1 Tax=Thermaurantimonas sp. TaxID=2681568 RepID=UPI003918F8DA
MERLQSHIHLQPERLHAWIQDFLKHSTHWRYEVAFSVEGRPIYTLHAGSKSERIVIWSQMHGNEATGTYALTDLLLSLEEEVDLLNFLLNRFSLIVVPMLNPDGAARFSRYNAIGSDLNREGLRTFSPEAALLKSLLEDNAVWAFNLHDQRTLFSVGSTSVPATLSLLAPSTITQRGEQARLNAIKLISNTLEMFEINDRKYIARFSDEYYPQAMGEWCTDRGISTVLVECGGYYNDPHRTKARQMCFHFLKNALSKISYPDETLSTSYFSLPINMQNLRDVILRNVKMNTPAGTICTDLSFSAVYQPLEKIWKWQLEEVGDLQLKSGYLDIDLSYVDPVDQYQWKPLTLYTLDDLPKTWHPWFTTT